MARRAPRAKEPLAGRRIADEHTRRLVPRLVVAGSFERMDERRDVGNLIRREGKLRHTAVGPTVLDDRRDELAMLIVEHDAGAKQARSAVAAARIDSVAERAVDAVERLAAGDRLWIGGWPIRISI